MVFGPATIAELEREAFANLDEPGPLGVYADALGQVGAPRGEYLTIASLLHTARMTTARALVESSLTGEAFVRTATQLRRAHQLLALHGRAWDADAEASGVGHQIIRALRIDRGLEFELEIDLDEIDQIQAVAGILSRVYVRRARLACKHVDVVRAARAPLWTNLRHVSLEGNPAIMELVPHLDRVESLALADDLPVAGLEGAAGSLIELRIGRADRAVLDALARMPLARRLRRLEIEKVFTDGSVFGEILDGRFPALEHLKVRLPYECEAPEGRAAASIPAHVPRSLEFVGYGPEAPLLAVFGRSQRLQCLRAPSIDRASLAAILSAPALDELHLRVEEGRVGAYLYDDAQETLIEVRQQFRALDLGDTELRPHVLAAIMRTHPLETFRCGGDLGAAIEMCARNLAPRRLRVLELRDQPLADESVVVLASAPAFAGLRRLVLAGTELSDAAVATIATAELLELVTLDLEGNVARLPGDVCNLPAIVEVKGALIGPLATRTRIRTHLGSVADVLPNIDNRIVVLLTYYLEYDEFEAMLADEPNCRSTSPGRFAIERPTGLIDVQRVNFPYDRSVKLYPAAAAGLSPPVTGKIAAIWLDTEPAAHDEAISLARRLALKRDGVVWDLSEDCVVPLH